MVCESVSPGEFDTHASVVLGHCRDLEMDGINLGVVAASDSVYGGAAAVGMGHLGETKKVAPLPTNHSSFAEDDASLTYRLVNADFTMG